MNYTPIESIMTSKAIYLGVIGVGGVGSHFLTQLSRLPNAPPLILLARSSVTATSPATCYSPAIDPDNWQSAFSASSPFTKSGAWEPEQIADYMSQAPGRAVLVDNTSDPTIAEAYPLFLSKGISIVTPNKKAFSSSFDTWKSIFDTAAGTSSLVYHESTVGAGLPVISTLRDLVSTGDRVTRIEGVFSGTLSFLFNNFAPVTAPSGSTVQKWSQVVSQAKELGYTEPDPRDDLNGMDVARKLTILARIAGLEVQSPESFPIESLIPAELEGVSSAEEFMQRLPEFDDRMEAIKEKAEVEGKVVRYVGSVDVAGNAVKVGLEKFDKDSAIAGLKGSDNIISFYTERYGKNPLIIQGAGAGGAVTAMGVSADLIKVLERLR
ncbi:homoserine dehydrogenase [Blastomyces dermatitidis ER-3]|uniref:Homoserine dehydrogenase n=1 Tax=Ajellomyces dermatitidis (strain ER-3 / ATCC MYA-2586) TaxID=559297 RepID=A0ABP2EP40_AJEDR|nr:homoserine dehydrogenase [Blastomyces dermatitidis ER-3]EEQ83984.2 homoserine dehydrogenase [Blastomyces dermatitidis ER-3]